MTGATLFTGIMAPETAAPEIDWKVCAEIEPFPCSVIAHYSKAPNLGNVMASDFIDRAKECLGGSTLDVLVFGSPCQGFSVAGKRLGLDDPRSNLALRALAIVDALRPAWFVFENVPGLFSSWSDSEAEGIESSDFAEFLRWVQDIGYSGAWSVLDAQFFGLAQRRDRVFFVGHAGDWRGPAAVLLEPESLCGYPPSRGEAREGITGGIEIGPSGGKRTEVNPTLDSRAKDGFIRNQLAGGVLQERCEVNHMRTRSGRSLPEIVGCMEHQDHGGISTQAALNGYITAADCHVPERGGMNRIDAESETLIAAPLGAGDGARGWRNDLDQGAFIPVKSQSGETGKGDAAPLVAMLDTLQYNGISHASTQETNTREILRVMREEIGAEAFAQWGLGVLDPLQETEVLQPDLLRESNRAEAAIQCRELGPVSCESAEDLPGWAVCAMRRLERSGCSPQGRRLAEQRSRELRAALSGLPYETTQRSSLVQGLRFSGGDIGLLREALSALSEVGQPTLGQRQSIHPAPQGYAVRRLTVIEAARLQGFPDTYLHQVPTFNAKGLQKWRKIDQDEAEYLAGHGVPVKCESGQWRTSAAADGPMYRALGNSMAVPVMAWILKRIQFVHEVTA